MSLRNGRKKEEELIFQVLNKVTAVNLVAPAGASAAAGLF
jgi:hypothetical protein